MIFSKGNNLLFLFILSQAFLSCVNQNPEEGRLSPLLDGLGNHHHPISTNVDLAQKYFDQGPEEAEKVYQADLQIFPVVYYTPQIHVSIYICCVIRICMY